MTNDAETRFPIQIDFTAWLGELGVYIPNARIVIHSTKWEDGGRAEGKPDYEMPSDVMYWLGDNATASRDTFIAMLSNYNTKRSASWYYTRINWAMQERMAKPFHFATRGLKT